MRTIRFLFVFMTLIITGCFYQPTPAPILTPTLSIQPTLALVNARLIDGTGTAPLPDAVVLIGDGKIAAVGSREKVPVPAGVQTIDLGGRTVLPGFFNAHVHGAINEDRLAKWAKNGVTTVCDMAAGGTSYPSVFTFRDSARSRPELARLAAAGPMITVPGGYPIAYWGGSGLTATSPEEAVKFTNALLDAGADYIKIPLESGLIFGQKMPMHSPEQAKAIVDAAHQRQSKVAVHISITTDLEKALNCGADTIAHMSTDRVPDALMQRMVAQGVYWIPTLELWEKVGPFAAVVEENLKRFAAVGGKVALGTDFLGAPNIDFDEGMPVFEISRMQAAGMSPMQIIVAATQNAAQACNQQDVTGTLRAGKAADLIVTQTDPLQDMAALKNLWLVIHSGVVIQDKR